MIHAKTILPWKPIIKSKMDYNQVDTARKATWHCSCPFMEVKVITECVAFKIMQGYFLNSILPFTI